MNDNKQKIECSICGEVIDEPLNLPFSGRKPCPKCGSYKRNLRIAISEELSLKEKTRLKVRGPKGGRPKYESIYGDDLHRKSGKWMRITRIIDRIGDWYKEVIVDPITNTVIHQNEERLSNHIGHGSDKIITKK
jgi:hypothetical protein